MTKPNPAMMVSMTVPPWETSGSGTPTTGARPITMPVLINTYNVNVATTPIAAILAKCSFVALAIDNPAKMTAR